MKEIKDIKLKVFEIRENYLIYCMEDKENYEIYIKNKKYGILDLIIGAPKTQQTLEQLLNLINFDEEIKLYQEEHEDMEDLNVYDL